MTSGVPFSLPTLPANTVVGRLATSAGQAEAIPFSSLAASLGVSAVSLIVTGIAGTNTITGATSTAPVLAANQIVWFIPTNNNTGATTFNRDGLGAINVYYNGAACASNEIVANVPTAMFYDGTQYNILSVPYSPYIANKIPAQTNQYNWTPFNADDRVWGSGVAVAKTSWTSYGAAGAYAKNTTAGQFMGGPAGSTITRAGTDCGQYQDIDTVPQWPALAFWKGLTVTWGRWVYATVANRARISIDDGVTTTYSTYHTGNSALQFLTVSKALAAGATRVRLADQVDTGNTAGVFSGGAFVIGSAVANTQPPAWQGRKCMFANSSGAATSTAAATQYLNWGAITATETSAIIGVPFKCAGRNLTAVCDAAAGGGQTFTYTVRVSGASSALTCQTAGGANVSSADVTHETVFSKLENITFQVVSSAGASTPAHRCALELEEVPL